MFINNISDYFVSGSGIWKAIKWTSPVIIGAHLSGIMDDVRIYNRSLTDRQIKYIFCQGAYNLQQKGEFNMPSWCKEYLP